jgi:hypothetical protein
MIMTTVPSYSTMAVILLLGACQVFEITTIMTQAQHTHVHRRTLSLL